MRRKFFLFVLIDFFCAQFNNPRIIIRKKLSGNYNAKTIPPFGIYVTEANQHNQKLIDHELYHWRQYQQSGFIIFYIRYIYQSVFYGYDRMSIEVQARKASGESPECLNDYTNCVRQGRAATIFNPDFRK